MAADLQKRLLAEWEAQDAILLALPHEDTDWAPILDQVQATYRSLIEAMARNRENVLLLCPSELYARKTLGEETAEKITLIEAEYNDTWTRDYGPITVETANGTEVLDFGFNGWGLKFASDHDNLVNLQLNEKGFFAPGTYQNNRDFVLEGGSIDTDGEGTILTTSRCLCSQNRNGGKSKEELEIILKERLGANHVIWLDYGALEGDDTDSHIDTLARLCPESTLVYVSTNAEDSHYEALSRMEEQIKSLRRADGMPYNLRALPLPDPVFDNNGQRLPATYANYLVTPRAIYMPQYDQEVNDQKAVEIIKTIFKKEIPVERIDCRPLIVQHGSLHCATMQLGCGTLNPHRYEV